MGLLPVQIVVVAKDSRETETITLNKDLEKALNNAAGGKCLTPANTYYQGI